MTSISSEQFANSSLENNYFLRGMKKTLRRNELKLRGNESLGPKNFSVSPWKSRNFFGGIQNFLYVDSDEPDGDLSNSYGGKAEAFGLSKNCCTFVAVITKAMVRWPSG